MIYNLVKLSGGGSFSSSILQPNPINASSNACWKTFCNLQPPPKYCLFWPIY